MADTYTTNLNLTKPEPGAAEDTWGISLNADLDSLDAIFSTSGTQINLNPNQINFADGKKAIFGTGSDLEIFHDGSNSYIKDTGTGTLRIQGSSSILMQKLDGEIMMIAREDGAVELNHNGSQKIKTTSSGIDVTGTVTSDGLTVDGVGSLDNNGLNLELSSSNTGIIYDAQNGYHTFKRNGTNALQINGGTGDVYFYEDTGTTQALFWDASAERLGLGTTSPSAALHISGTSADQIRLERTNHDTFRIGLQSAVGLGFHNVTDNRTDMMIKGDGKIGIGTASPSTALHVSAGDGSAELTVARTGTYASSWSLKPYNADFYIRESGSDRVTIKAGGSVGIGTTSPSQKLHVYNAGNAGALIEGTNVTFLKFSDPNTNAHIGTYNNGTLRFGAENNAQTNHLVINSSGNVGIGTASPQGNLHVEGAAGVSGGGIIYVTDADNGSTASDALQISKSGDTAFIYNRETSGNLQIGAGGNANHMIVRTDGKVGIGTTSPTYALEVRDDSNILLQLASTTTSNNARMVFAPNNTAIFNIGVDVSSSAFTWYDVQTATSPIKIEQGAATNSLVLKSDSKVGIGTSVPNAPLHVKSSIDYVTRFESTDTTAGIVLQDSNSSGRVTNTNGHLILSADINNQVSNSAIRFMLDTSSNAGADAAMVVRSTGLGIGTTSPTRALDVSKSGSTILANFKNTGGTSSFITLGNTTSTADQIRVGSNGTALTFSTNYAERMRIDSSGRVGIGTSSPSKRVHIKNSTNDDDNILLVEGSGTTTYGIYLKSSYAGQMGRVGALSQSDGGLDGASVAFEDFGRDIAFRTNEGSNNAERARILSGGAFLIGKTALGVNNTGLQFNGGLLAVTKDGGEPLILNRKTTDGVVADFRKDNTSVGNTRSFGGDLIIQTGITGLRFNDANDAIHPVIVNGSVSDNATDLGLSNARFKDLRLAGKAYVGSMNVDAAADGVLIDLRKDNNTGGIIGIQEPQDNAEELYIANGTGTSSVGLAFWDYINTSRIAPCNGTGAYQDNSIDLGFSSARFDDIYATNGTIQTSDRNEKQDIQALTDAEQRVATACKGLIRRFRWQDAVEEKGDDARYHFGVIAQDLQDAFTAEGLDAGNYGMFISSTWEDDDGVEQTRLGVRYNELLAFIITTL